MPKNMWSKKFDEHDEFVARRELTLGDGTSLSPGDAVPQTAFPTRRLRQLYDQRVIVTSEAWADQFNEPEPYIEKTPTLVPADDAADADMPLVTDVADEPVVEKKVRKPRAPKKLPGLPGLPGTENKTDGESS